MTPIQVLTKSKEVYSILDDPIAEYYMGDFSTSYKKIFERQIRVNLDVIKCSKISLTDGCIQIFFNEDDFLYEGKAYCILLQLKEIKKIYFNEE